MLLIIKLKLSLILDLQIDQLQKSASQLKDAHHLVLMIALQKYQS